jgi:hypothetical protein
VWRVACGRIGVGRIKCAKRFAMKWQHTIAQGFYEAELVKAALQKSIFLKYCLVWTAIRRQGTYDWLFGA